MKTRLNRRSTHGFTLTETLVMLVLGTLIAGALYNVLVFQQRFYTRENDASVRHDALRVAAAVLMSDLVEASSSEGDFAAIGTDSIRVRSPVGFAIVCSVDAPGQVLGLFNVQGRVSDPAGDTLLIYHPDGWLRRRITELNPSAFSGMDCDYSSGPAIETRIRVNGSTAGVPVGAPVRAFHTYTYRLQKDGDSWWLVRSDGDVVDVLAGPLDEEGSGLRFAYFDADGDPTADPTQVERVRLTLVAAGGAADTRMDTLQTSVWLRNQ